MFVRRIPLQLVVFIVCGLLMQPLVATAQTSDPFDDSGSVRRSTRLDSGTGLETYDEIAEFAVAVLTHLDAVWTAWMEGNGFPYEPYVNYVLLYPGDRYLIGCADDEGDNTVSGEMQNALYCAADDTMYLPLDFLGNHVWTYNLGAVPGDFALATTIAHEFSHHIMREIYLQANAVGYAIELPGTVKGEELFADCLAGVWAYAVYLDDLLETDDLREAVEHMYAAGDYDYDPVTHHGTPDERVEAWILGLNGSTTSGFDGVPGAPANCMQAYWR